VIKRDIVTSTSEYAQNQKAFADFKFDGWGAYVQYNFAMERDLKFGNNQVLYVAWRRIVTGFFGYEFAPALTDTALALLKLPNGEAVFKQYYGDYYVKGCVNGASMKIVVKTRTSSSASTSVDGNMRSGWNQGFLSNNGNAAFA